MISKITPTKDFAERGKRLRKQFCLPEDATDAQLAAAKLEYNLRYGPQLADESTKKEASPLGNASFEYKS